MVKLAVLGAINWDISIFVERFARQGEEVVVRQVHEFSGGKGANVAVAAARILGKDNVCFIGALGNDSIARLQLEELRREGVNTECVEITEKDISGRAYIMIDSRGKKQINTYFGANKLLSKEHIKKNCMEKLTQAEAIVIMDVSKDVAELVSRIALEYKRRYIYSPGVMVRHGVDFIKKIAAGSEYVVLDTAEILNLYGTNDDELAIMNARKDLRNAIITRGEKGCTIIREERLVNVRAYDPREFDGQVVNTTGCGDAFLGVLVSYIVLGQSISQAARLANLAGAIKATRFETRGSPTRAELERIYELIEGIKLHQRKMP